MKLNDTKCKNAKPSDPPSKSPRKLGDGDGLALIPEQAVDTVLKAYDGNYSLFIYRGARLLKNIFTELPKAFEQKLISVIQSKQEKDILFVMAILKNYDGKPVIHNVCKELIKVLPDDDSLINEVSIILQSTGVVSGEYGFVEAYKQKIEETKPWLKDKDNKIQDFAKDYISRLEKQIEYEKKRADEDIALRKHQYGDEN